MYLYFLPIGSVSSIKHFMTKPKAYLGFFEDGGDALERVPFRCGCFNLPRVSLPCLGFCSDEEHSLILVRLQFFLDR